MSPTECVHYDCFRKMTYLGGEIGVESATKRLQCTAILQLVVSGEVGLDQRWVWVQYIPRK